MIKSMTGFGRSEYTDGKRSISVEIKAVNHRYSDITIKMPRRYAFAEEKLKGVVRSIARRGKIDVSINVENLTEDDTEIKLNLAMAKQYQDNLVELKDALNVEGDITLEFIASLPDVLKTVPMIEDEESIYKSLEIPVKEAVKKLNEMREIEGRKLAEDIIKRGDLIRELVNEIRKKSSEVPKAYAEKLRDRIQELIGNNLTVPEDRIMVEAAIFADKCNIIEELVRLDSHISQLNDIIQASTEPDGKKLDFLVQEMNREANTIGSKANDLEITNHVLNIKSQIENIREQVQNIE
ncbi:MAG: YicC/YloC family endoribonuclease [Anaerovoracaceae bacterium]|jgi:uncharacterized protein (TIGR00255 family)